MTLDIRWTSRDDVVARLASHLRATPDDASARDLLHVLAPHHVDPALIADVVFGAFSIEDLEAAVRVAARKRALSPRLLHALAFWPRASPFCVGLLTGSLFADDPELVAGCRVIADEVFDVWFANDRAATAWALTTTSKALPSTARALRLRWSATVEQLAFAMRKSEPTVVRRAALRFCRSSPHRDALHDVIRGIANQPGTDDVDLDAVAVFSDLDVRCWHRLAAIALEDACVRRRCRAAALWSRVPSKWATQSPRRWFDDVARAAADVANAASREAVDRALVAVLRGLLPPDVFIAQRGCLC